MIMVDRSHTHTGYLSNRYMGSIIGRVVNRVADGFLFIDGKRYNLTKNDETSQHQINGGFHAFDNVNWDACVVGKQVVRILCSLIIDSQKERCI